MKKSSGFLDDLAAEFGVFISDFQVTSHLRKKARDKLKRMNVPPERRAEWLEAMAYLSEGGQPV